MHGNTTTMSTHGTSKPGVTTTMPTNGTSIHGDTTTMPTNGTSKHGDTTTMPTSGTSKHGVTTTMPTNGTSIHGDTTTMPTYEQLHTASQIRHTQFKHSYTKQVYYQQTALVHEYRLTPARFAAMYSHHQGAPIYTKRHIQQWHITSSNCK
jgi:hypothetical protein